jgi:outer membrane protein assembly factor BamE (lipoprotein component of BamABCDE complex)
MRPGRTPLRWLLWPVLALLAALLAACAAPDRLPLGSSRDEALAKLGPPSAVHRLPDGDRLQYSFQPAGPWVHNLDFDASGRLRRNTQVMDPADFGQIVIDQWTRADVLLRYGRPALVEQVASFEGDIWTYRYLEISRRRMLHVHIDPGGVVRRVMSTDEPEPSERTR